MKLSRSVLVALCLGLCVPLAGCSRSPSASSSESLLESDDALIEGHEAGTVAWIVAPDGKVQAVVKDASGTLVTAKATGQVTFASPGVEQTVHLKLDDKSGLLEATGPKLGQDLNEVRYALIVDGKPWTGSLMVPAGGTKSLADQARAEASLNIEAGAGPHGGVVQVVGDDRVEIVADKPSGRVRVYVLGPDLKPVAVGPRKLKLGVHATGSSEVVILNPNAEGAYFEGKISLKAQPVKLTVAVTIDAKTQVALVGYHPGTVVIVGGGHAHPVNIWIDAHFDDDHHDHGRGHAYGHDHGNVKVDVKVKGGGHGHGGGKSSVKIKVH